MATSFSRIYKRFYSKITDDMYMELDQAQTDKLLFELLENAIDWFEFPRVNLSNYNEEDECFNVTLSREEINILATYMVVGWIDQQLASIENVRMKYSSSDFKFTSQANHISKLTSLRNEYKRTGFHLQRLYKRRKADANGVMRSTMGSIMSSSVREGNSWTTPSSGVSSGSDGDTSGGGNDQGSDSWGDMEDDIFSDLEEEEGEEEDKDWEDMGDL